MKARLIKSIDNGWPVYSLRREDGKMIATTRFPFDQPALMIAKNAGIELQKLSHENCEQIFGIYHPSELSKVLTEGERGAFEFGYCLAREHNRHKIFTLEDMNNAMHWIMTQYFEFYEHPTTGRIDAYLKSLLEPTEIEVEVEMKKVVDERKTVGAVKGVYGSGHKITTYKTVQSLDDNGCLILKKL